MTPLTSSLAALAAVLLAIAAMQLRRVTPAPPPPSRTTEGADLTKRLRTRGGSKEVTGAVDGWPIRLHDRIEGAGQERAELTGIVVAGLREARGGDDALSPQAFALLVTAPNDGSALRALLDRFPHATLHPKGHLELVRPRRELAREPQVLAALEEAIELAKAIVEALPLDLAKRVSAHRSALARTTDAPTRREALRELAVLAPASTADLAAALMSDADPSVALQAALVVAKASGETRGASLTYQLFLADLIDAYVQGTGPDLLTSTLASPTAAKAVLALRAITGAHSATVVTPGLEQQVIDCLGRLELTKRAEAIAALAKIGGQAAIDALAPLGTGGSRSARGRDRQAEVRLVDGAIASIRARLNPSQLPPNAPAEAG